MGEHKYRMISVLFGILGVIFSVYFLSRSGIQFSFTLHLFDLILIVHWSMEVLSLVLLFCGIILVIRDSSWLVRISWIAMLHLLFSFIAVIVLDMILIPIPS